MFFVMFLSGNPAATPAKIWIYCNEPDGNMVFWILEYLLFVVN